MAVAQGARLGAYEILAPLGSGGMGEVYRARDPRLGREVAIKVLAQKFSADPERLRRFELEARAAAALNHPNILAVYDIGSHESGPYIVSELLSGETLRDSLRDGGPALSVHKAVEYAIQIARGLAAAHDKGIVHRDLKPENLFVTADGRVKILDFGLAKLTKDEPAALSTLPTSPPPTEPGVVLGTAGYMSPEQVRGLTADHRSDIFALGAIFHELLSGRGAFLRGTGVETMHAILNEEAPDLPTAERRIPPALARIVRRCLEKSPAGRFQTASDLAFALESVSAGADSATTVGALDIKGPSRWRREHVAWAATAVAFVAGIAAAVLLWSRPVPEVPLLRLDVTTPRTSVPGSFALSPDGRQIVFVATADGVSRLWRRPLDQTTAQPLAGTEGATDPFWAPDNRSIGFFADGKLKRLDLAGGPPQELADAPNSRGGTWSRDGVILFTSLGLGGLKRVPETGGTVVAVSGVGARFPAFLPDGRRFVFFVGPTTPDRQGIYLGSLDAPETRRLMPADVPGAYIVPGYMLMLRQGVLVAVPFDATSEAILGEPVPIAQGVGADFGSFRGAFSVSATGLLAYRTWTDHRQLAWTDRRGIVVGTLGPPDDTFLLYPEIAPDGRVIAIQRFEKGNFDLWLIDVARGVWRRFTTDTGVDRASVWAPDSSRIVFSSDRSGVYDLLEKAADGSGDERALFTSSTSKLPADWSPDGRFVLYATSSSDTRTDLWALPLDQARKPFPVVHTRSNEDEGQFSPDGRWIAYTSDESGRDEVYLQEFPGPGRTWKVSTEGGGQPRWRSNGKELFYIARDATLMAVPIDLPSTGQTVVLGAPLPLFPTRLASRGARKQQYAVAEDGQRFLMNVVADEEIPSPITIVQNWLAMLKN